MKQLLWGIFLILLPSLIFAQTVKVRGGEHEGFTRLVLDLPRQVPWVVEGGCLTSALMGPNSVI